MVLLNPDLNYSEEGIQMEEKSIKEEQLETVNAVYYNTGIRTALSCIYTTVCALAIFLTGYIIVIDPSGNIQTMTTMEVILATFTTIIFCILVMLIYWRVNKTVRGFYKSSPVKFTKASGVLYIHYSSHSSFTGEKVHDYIKTIRVREIAYHRDTHFIRIKGMGSVIEEDGRPVLLDAKLSNFVIRVKFVDGDKLYKKLCSFVGIDGTVIIKE